MESNVHIGRRRMSHHVWAAALSSTTLVIMLITLKSAGMQMAMAILGGGLLPAVISWTSMALMLNGRQPIRPSQYQRIMLINFFVKAGSMTAWTTIVLSVTDWPRAVFITSLLTHFLLWQMLEAWATQRRLVTMGKVQFKAVAL